jgi:hypothetical protein
MNFSPFETSVFLCRTGRHGSFQKAANVVFEDQRIFCCYLCSVVIFFLFLSLFSFYLCSVVIFILLLSLFSCYLRSVVIFVLLLSFFCFYLYYVVIFALLLSLSYCCLCSVLSLFCCWVGLIWLRIGTGGGHL